MAYYLCKTNPTQPCAGREPCSSYQKVTEKWKQFIPTSQFSSQIMFPGPLSKTHYDVSMVHRVGKG